MQIRRLMFVLLVGILVALLAACGSESGAAVGTQAEEGPLALRSGDTFTVDSFVEGGWKKSKEFSTETVPLSTSIWYGFYSHRDVEIRFYGSHADALTAGVESDHIAECNAPQFRLLKSSPLARVRCDRLRLVC